MGHITIVGPSLGNVEKLLESMLNEERSDGQSAGSYRLVVEWFHMIIPWLQVLCGYMY